MNYSSHPRLQIAAKAIKNGRVAVYPTEAVWGLGADPFNPLAVSRILSLKNRSVEKGLILVASDIRQFGFIVDDLPSKQRKILQDSWPGPFNWLVPHSGRVPSWICGQFDTVALRVSAHPVVQALCDAVGGPIVSTSANPQGLAPAGYAYRARQYFGDSVTYCPGQVGLLCKPCEIRDLNSGQVVRQ